MPATQSDKLGGQNVAAFLEMLATSEIGERLLAKSDNGYNVLVGGGLFDSYVKHPNKLVPLNRVLYSTAAGRYQFLHRTWAELQRMLKLPDFGPESQDLAAVALLKRRKAFDLVQAGKFDEAVHRCRKEWASLPGAGYGQHEQKIERLRAAYLNAGGQIA